MHSYRKCDVTDKHLKIGFSNFSFILFRVSLHEQYFPHCIKSLSYTSTFYNGIEDTERREMCYPKKPSTESSIAESRTAVLSQCSLLCYQVRHSHIQFICGMMLNIFFHVQVSLVICEGYVLKEFGPREYQNCQLRLILD